MIATFFLNILIFSVHLLFGAGAVVFAIPGVVVTVAIVIGYIGSAIYTIPLISLFSPFVIFILGWKSSLVIFQGGRMVANFLRGSGA